MKRGLSLPPCYRTPLSPRIPIIFSHREKREREGLQDINTQLARSGRHEEMPTRQRREEMRASEDLFQRDDKKNAVVREKAARDEHVLGPKGGGENQVNNRESERATNPKRR